MLRRALAAAWAVLSLVRPMYGASPEPTAAIAPETVKALGPIRENTMGELRLFALLQSEAERRSLPVSSVSITEHSGSHSFSQVLEIRVQGTGEGTLVLAFPLADGMPWGDGSHGIVAALDLLDRLAADPPEVSVRVAFLGADEDFLGSRAYSDYLSDEASLAVLRVEMGEWPSDSAEILFAGSGELSPSWLLDLGVETVRAAGLRDVVRANRSMLHRLGLTDAETALDPWFRVRLPALALRVRPNDGTDAFSGEPSREEAARLLESFVRSVSGGIPDTWDRQYIIFEAAGLRLKVGETQYIAMVLAVFAALGLVFALDSLRRRDILLEDLRKVPRGLPALAAVFAVCFLCILASRILLSVLIGTIGAPGFWRVHPVAFSVVRLVQILSLFLCLSSLLARMRVLPHSAEFFRGSAVVVLGADVLLFSAVRVSLSFLFLWAFLVVLMGRRIGRRLHTAWPSAFALPASLLPLGFFLSELVFFPEYEAYGSFLLPGFTGTAYLCFMALPFLLLIVAFGEGIFGPRFYRARTALIGGAAFLAVSLVSGVLGYADARGYAGITDVILEEYADEDFGTLRIEASGLRPLPVSGVRLPGGGIRYDGRSSFHAETLPLSRGALSLRAEGNSFLDRNQISLHVEASGTPLRFRIEIPDMESGSVYDSSYPLESTPDGRGVFVSVGVRPPNPLTVSLTVSGDFSATAFVTAEYESAPVPVETEGPIRITEHRAEYRKGIRLSTGQNPAL